MIGKLECFQLTISTKTLKLGSMALQARNIFLKAGKRGVRFASNICYFNSLPFGFDDFTPEVVVQNDA